MKKKILLDWDYIKAGELIFEHGKKTERKRFVEFERVVVLVVPIEKNNVYLLREYRPFLKKTVWRLPAGTVKPKESALKAAKRELLQEAGLKADKMELLRNYNYIGWVKFPIYIFKATGLKVKKPKLEFYEKIKLVKVTKEKAIKIALDKMEEVHHAFALLKVLEPILKETC